MATPAQPEKKRRVEGFQCPSAQKIREKVQKQIDEVRKEIETRRLAVLGNFTSKFPDCMDRFENELLGLGLDDVVAVEGQLIQSVDCVMVRLVDEVSKEIGYFATHDQWNDIILPQLRTNGFTVEKIAILEESQGYFADESVQTLREKYKSEDDQIYDIGCDVHEDTVYLYHISL